MARPAAQPLAASALPSATPGSRAVLRTAYAAREPIDGDLAFPAGNASPPLLASPPAEMPTPIAPRPAASAEAPAPLIKHAPPAGDNPVVVSPRVLPGVSLSGPGHAASAGRSRDLEAVAQQADRHTRQGYELAGRGAYYAARREFTTALRLVAEGLDAEGQTRFHTRALGAALTAVAEAQDFLPARDRLEADLNTADVVARHRTPVLKGAAEDVVSADAMKSYFTFAQEQIAVAVEHEVAGSMALGGLGKLYAALAGQEALRTRTTESTAMTFFQAALLADPRNFMAANDLGVLLARSGYYAEARAALERSLSVCPQAAGWRNLAQVYRRLGDQDRAARAERLCELAERARTAAGKRPSPAGRVDWIDPRAFAQSFAQTPSAHDPPPARSSGVKPEQPVAQKPFGNLFDRR